MNAGLDNEPELMSIAQWGWKSGMSRSAIYRALGRGDLKAVKIGRAVRIEVKSGNAWLASLPAAQTRVSA